MRTFRRARSQNITFTQSGVLPVALLAFLPTLFIPLAAQAETDTVVDVPASEQRLSQSAINQAKPHRNRLARPNIESLKPSQQSQANSSGAMGAQGAAGTSRAFGTFGVPYTAKRVSLKPTSAVSATNGGYLSATYPYSAIGRLTFRVGSFTSWCSASVIRRSVIVTAAHCIQDFGSGSNTFTNFTFVPGFYNGAAPYGSWSAQAFVRPASWANGTDIGSGAARDNDLAVIALRPISGQFIGSRTGQVNYGWNNYSFVSSSRTGNLSVAALSTLGYPGLLDAGRIMQRSDGPSFLTTIGGAGQIYQGSTFTGGSSGGPWIANFGYQNPSFSGGASAGNAAINNVVVGVTSWGAADPNNPKDNFSSQFRQNSRYPNASYGIYGAGNIASLLNTLCSSRPSGSSQTYAQLGYCN
uniref:Peptidase S1 domain-containing protein n=1 Tax=Cyanothece sp. (strain PCC 7425 / ATCC 29141) TaxID=395961 RepID=B8HME3_CYAP4